MSMTLDQVAKHIMRLHKLNTMMCEALTVIAVSTVTDAKGIAIEALQEFQKINLEFEE